MTFCSWNPPVTSGLPSHSQWEKALPYHDVIITWTIGWKGNNQCCICSFNCVEIGIKIIDLYCCAIMNKWIQGCHHNNALFGISYMLPIKSSGCIPLLIGPSTRWLQNSNNMMRVLQSKYGCHDIKYLLKNLYILMTYMFHFLLRVLWCISFANDKN